MTRSMLSEIAALGFTPEESEIVLRMYEQVGATLTSPIYWNKKIMRRALKMGKKELKAQN